MAAPAHIARENGKKGGRPKGRKGNKTLEKEIVKKHFDERILRATDSLINSQLSLAIGQQFLYKIEKEWIKTGETKNGKDIGYWKNLKPKIVESQSEIEMFLEGEAEYGDKDDENDPSATYYFLTTKEPNNEAIKDLQNRVHGKPRETLAVDVTHKFSLKGLAQRRIEVLKNEKKAIEAKIITPEVPIENQ